MTAKPKATKASPPAKRVIRQPLDTVGGLLAEAGRVYRLMRAKKMDHDEGRSLVWVLSQMRGMVETQALERLEARLDELAPALDKKPAADRPSYYAH